MSDSQPSTLTGTHLETNLLGLMNMRIINPNDAESTVKVYFCIKNGLICVNIRMQLFLINKTLFEFHVSQEMLPPSIKANLERYSPLQPTGQFGALRCKRGKCLIINQVRIIIYCHKNHWNYNQKFVSWCVIYYSKCYNIEKVWGTSTCSKRGKLSKGK